MSNYDINWEQYFRPDHWWKLDEVNYTSTIYDSGSVGGKNGYITAYADPPINGMPGKPLRSYRFYQSCVHVDGFREYINACNLNQITFAVWFRLVGSYYEYDWQYIGGNTYGFELGIRPYDGYDGCYLRWCLQTTATSWGNAEIFSDAPIDSDGKWYHVVGTYDGNIATLYVNGVKQTNQVSTYGNVLCTDNREFRIACVTDSTPDDINFLDGEISDVRFYKRALSASEVNELYKHTGNYRYNKPHSIVNIPMQDKYTKLYLPFDRDYYDHSPSRHRVDPYGTVCHVGYFADASGNKHPVNMTFSPNVTFDFKPSGGTENLGSCCFNHPVYTCELNVPHHSDFTLGSRDFSIDFWWYALTTGSADLITKRQGGVHGWITIYHQGNGSLGFYLCSEFGSWLIYNYTLIQLVALKTWYHIAICRKENYIYGFVNGVEVMRLWTDATVYESGVDPVYIMGGADGYAAGYLSNLRVERDFPRWTSNFTPPTAPYSSIEYPTNPGNTGYVTGTDGHLATPSDNYITNNFIPCTADYESGGWWGYDDLQLNIGDCYWNNQYLSVGSNGDLYASFGVITNYTNLYFSPLSALWHSFASAEYNGLKTWYLPKTADRSTDGGYFTFYYNYQAWYTAFNMTDADIRISVEGAVYKDSISPANLVNDEYGNVGPAGNPTKLLVTFSGFGKFDGHGCNFTATDNLLIPPSDDFNFRAGDFTVDFWVNFRQLDAHQAIIGVWNDGGTGGSWYILFNNDQARLRFYYKPSGSEVYLEDDFVFSTYTWYHIAYVRSGTTLKLFINGVQQSSWSIGSVEFSQSSLPLTIGTYKQGGGQYFNGFLSEVRISKGIARWTSDFTPPTEPYANKITSMDLKASSMCSKWPTHWWKLNETEGNAIIDYGTQPVYAVMKTPKLFTMGCEGHKSGTKSMLFHKTSGSAFRYIDTNHISPTLSNFSIGCWVKRVLPATSPNGAIVSQHNGGEDVDCFYLYTNNVHSITFSCRVADTWETYTVGTNDVPFGVWFHVAVTFEASNYLTMYINGVVVESVLVSEYPIQAQSSYTMKIGDRQDLTDTTHAESAVFVEDLQLYYHQTLTSGEVARLYKNGLVTNALGDYCARYYPSLLERHIKAASTTRFSNKIFDNSVWTIDANNDIIIKAEDL